MGTLRNWRHELYARELVEVYLAGYNQRELPKERLKAYTKSGFAPNADNARRDSNKPDIKARISELTLEALEYRNVRPATVVTRIDRVGRANLADFFEADGRTLRNIKELPRELTEALAAIEWDDGVPKVKLHDKNQANFTLLKHMGGLPDDTSDRTPTNVNVFAGLSLDDQRTLLEALEALSGKPRAIESEAA